jgi:ligand-binding sensor domain-containing protein/two-component sensor histidine kinase
LQTSACQLNLVFQQPGLNRSILYIIVLCLLSAAVSAQNKQYVFNRFSVKDGLASNYVHSILQDKKGFMWFGTASGIQRYDGKKIISFRPPASDSSHVPVQAITQVMLDRKNRFWVRTGKDVGLFNTATFVYRRVPIEANKQDIELSSLQLYEDRAGNVFLVLSWHGIFVFDEKKQAFIKDIRIIDHPSGAFISTFQQDPHNDNYYWLSTGKGLAVFDRAKRTLYTHEFNPIGHPALDNKVINAPATSLLIDSSGRFWVSNWIPEKNIGLVSCFHPASNKLVSPINVRTINGQYTEIHTLKQQRSGSIWTYGIMLLAEYNPVAGSFEQVYNRFPEDFGIRYDAVHCFYEDREQNVWLGTDQGIYVFNPHAQRFTSISLLDPRSTDVTSTDRSLTSFLQLGKGDIWASSWGNGIFTYDSAFRSIQVPVQKNMPADNNYYMSWSMLEHSATKKIWIGCQMGRLMLYDDLTKKTTYHNPPAMDARTIRTMAEDPNGNVWMGTQHGKLVRWDFAKGSKDFESGFELMHQFKSHVYRVKTDKHGLIWVASHMEGVTVLDGAGNIITTYNDKGGPGRSLYRNMATDVEFYNDSTVAIAAGIVHMLNRRTGAIQQITMADGLPSNTVNTMETDGEGNLWLGMIDGLCRFNVKRKLFTLFSQRDGIVRNEFHNGNSYRLRDGRIVFSNPHDFVFFDPRQILPSSPPPDVSITDFKLFNNYLPPDSILQLDKVKLDHNQNSITIEFAALSFLQKDKMIYYTKMEGIDKEWTPSQQYNVVNYTLLPPGNYTFKVRCENGDGLASSNITSLRIHIRPPFWQQEWFIMLCILALGGIIYIAHRMRVAQLIEMEKVRGRIARDLHDDMGSTLSTINILSEMARMKVVKDPEKTSEYIGKISDNSNRMMEAMDDIVWSINPMNDSMQRITARMREFATGLLEARNIDVEFKVEEGINHLTLDMESRRDFFLIFKEAINNIAKYSNCTHAVIDILLQGSRLIMLIRDNGVGFNVQEADNGNGLTNMKKRAQSLKGSLTVDSVIGVGTKVRLEAPLT